MTQGDSRQGVIPAGSVRRADQSVLVDTGEGVHRHHEMAMSVIPLLEDDMVVGLEVRCSCGTAVVIECVYEGFSGAPTPVNMDAAGGLS